jgi:alpha-tubulin suppressor-like RCC1 family protein
MKLRRRTWFAVVLVGAFIGCALWSRFSAEGRLKLPAGPISPLISLGRSHGLVLAPDGSIWTWGGENLGWPTLGLGQTNGIAAFRTVLQRISPATNWVGVSAGSDHNLALKADGTIWAWGANYRGQLGDGYSGRRAGSAKPAMQSSPVASAPGNDWAQVEAGSVCSYALKKDGTLWSWGLNNFCQLGIGSWVDSAVAVQVGSATNWMLVRAGGVSAGGIQSDGSLWIWGGSPKFGNTVPQSTSNLLVPTRISPDANWVDLSVDYNLWLAVKADGTLWAWGQLAHAYTGAPQSAC